MTQKRVQNDLFANPTAAWIYVSLAASISRRQMYLNFILLEFHARSSLWRAKSGTRNSSSWGGSPDFRNMIDWLKKPPTDAGPPSVRIVRLSHTIADTVSQVNAPELPNALQNRAVVREPSFLTYLLSPPRAISWNITWPIGSMETQCRLSSPPRNARVLACSA